MSDLLVPFDRFDRPLPAGLPFIEPGPLAWDVLGDPVDPQDPHWSDCFVDLSAPREVDGEPVRLDALPWAIGVLGRRLGIGGAETALLRVDDIEALMLRGAGHGRMLVGPSCNPDFVRGARSGSDDSTTIVPGWPTLDGLDEDAALRAIVAAALRARVGLGEVSP